jgi:hypothetical protein
MEQNLFARRQIGTNMEESATRRRFPLVWLIPMAASPPRISSNGATPIAESNSFRGDLLFLSGSRGIGERQCDFAQRGDRPEATRLSRIVRLSRIGHG